MVTTSRYRDFLEHNQPDSGKEDSVAWNRPPLAGSYPQSTSDKSQTRLSIIGGVFSRFKVILTKLLIPKGLTGGFKVFSCWLRTAAEGFIHDSSEANLYRRSNDDVKTQAGELAWTLPGLSLKHTRHAKHHLRMKHSTQGGLAKVRSPDCILRTGMFSFSQRVFLKCDVNLYTHKTTCTGIRHTVCCPLDFGWSANTSWEDRDCEKPRFLQEVCHRGTELCPKCQARSGQLP